MSVQSVKKSLRPKPTERPLLWLSSGSTLLNLACSGNPEGCFIAGHFYFLVGDSDSGKTFLALTCLAEASINPLFDNYRFIYDAPEGGALMDIKRFFGSGVASRLEAPSKEKDGTPHHSGTIQEFYYHVDDALNAGRPCIYILDSQDCLTSKEEIEKFDKSKTAFRKGALKELAGSYGDGKAKVNSSHLRKLMTPLERTGSILIIINQTRDSFDMFEKSTHSGGRSLKFYATLQLWSSCAGKLKRSIMGKERQLGVSCKVRVKKNRVNGRDRTVLIPIFHSYGIDDVGGMIDYLISEGVWKKSGSSVEVVGLGPSFDVASKEKLIKKIEDDGLEDDLRELVTSTWQDIEKACEVERKARYV